MRFFCVHHASTLLFQDDSGEGLKIGNSTNAEMTSYNNTAGNVSSRPESLKFACFG